MKEIQAVKKILAEFPFFDGASRQAVRGGDDPDCDGNTCSASDPTHLVTLIGCEGMVVVHTADATLVMPASHAQQVKDLHAEVKAQHPDKA